MLVLLSHTRVRVAQFLSRLLCVIGGSDCLCRGGFSLIRVCQNNETQNVMEFGQTRKIVGQYRRYLDKAAAKSSLTDVSRAERTRYDMIVRVARERSLRRCRPNAKIWHEGHTDWRFVLFSHLRCGRDGRDPVLVGHQLAAVLKLVSHVDERYRYR